VALAEALVLLLRNRDLAEQMGRAGRELALKHFSETNYIDKIVRLYEMLLLERRYSGAS
jgi:glycosyltransferase involved in cell wall biosynthesis